MKATIEAVQERPIPFKVGMVRAILAGRKTQTRRVIEPQPIRPPFPCHWVPSGWSLEGLPNEYGNKGCSCIEVKCRFWEGQRLWVREPTRLVATDNGHLAVSGVREGAKVEVEYLADGERRWVGYPTRLAGLEVGCGLPNGCYREAARIALEVTDVRPERIQEITEADAIEEGVEALPPAPPMRGHQRAFKSLWAAMNGLDSWEANRWVWVVLFKRIEA